MHQINDTLRAFNALWKRMSEVYRAYAVRMGVSESELWVLYALVVLGEGCTQRDVCTEMCLPKQTVHSSVRKLEREGFLTCMPGKGRDVRLVPTEQGRARIAQVALPLIRAEEEAFAALPHDACERAFGLVGRYVDVLRALTEPASEGVAPD